MPLNKKTASTSLRISLVVTIAIFLISMLLQGVATLVSTEQAAVLHIVMFIAGTCVLIILMILWAFALKKPNTSFIDDGFFGVKQAEIDLLMNRPKKSSEGENIYDFPGYLPSHIRDNELDIDQATILYGDKALLQKRLPEYTGLVNKRRDEINKFLHADTQNVYYLVLNEEVLMGYAKKDFCFSNKKPDDHTEVVSRFNGLIELINTHTNFILVILPSKDSTLRSGPHFLLKEKSAMIFDLRDNELRREYDPQESIDGLYTSEPSTMTSFYSKIRHVITPLKHGPTHKAEFVEQLKRIRDEASQN